MGFHVLQRSQYNTSWRRDDRILQVPLVENACSPDKIQAHYNSTRCQTEQDYLPSSGRRASERVQDILSSSDDAIRFERQILNASFFINCIFPLIIYFQQQASTILATKRDRSPRTKTLKALAKCGSPELATEIHAPLDS